MEYYYYHLCFGGLVALCIALLVSQPTRKQALERDPDSPRLGARDDEHPEARWYKAYVLAAAADWLQGPYLFSLYKDEYNLSPDVILNLYITDFITTALSAYIIGVLADKHGRKLYSMVYCVTYALSCFLTVVPITPLLFAGRVLGGISSSILFAVFDSWMVTNFRERRLAADGCDLTRTYAATGVVNCLAAMLSGVVGEVLVWATGSKKSPFLLSVVLLWLALQAIWSRWVENFGAEASSSTRTRPSVWSILKTPPILALAFASTMFDGSMNLFVFYWIPKLNSLRPTASSGSELPHGVIYSSFMAVSMAAALAFNIIMDKQVVKYSRLAVGVTSVAAFCFARLAGAKNEAATFWLFCLLQACVGMFTPCVGYLKASLIDDDARTTVYSVMRIPFNILVIVSLLVAKDNSNIDGVFTTCALMLMASLTTMGAASLRGMP
ncbi:DUF791-domain-containing protein [Xylaria scruposa]|nr:DUF791-domain-containing protein [Xylaria scruposa]